MLTFSCSSDDNATSNPDQEPEPTTATFIKSVKVNSPDSDGQDNIYTITFDYDDEKNVTKLIYSESAYADLTYVNGNIDKMIYYENGTQESRSAFKYQNGKVAYGLIADGPEDIDSERVEFTYNADGKLSKRKYCGTPAGCESINMSTYSDYIYSGNNISNETEKTYSWTAEINYQYDNYKNPFKNYSENFKIVMNHLFSFPLSENNIISQSTRINNSTNTVTYTLTYNEEGFPETMKGTRDGKLYVSYEYEYTEL